MAFSLRIGGSLVRIDPCGVELSLGPEHTPFVVEEPGDPDLWLTFRDSGHEEPSGELLFDGDGMFRFTARVDDGPLLSVASGPRLDCQVAFSPDYARADYRLAPWPATERATLGALPRGYELACQGRLGRLGVLLVHAVGLDLDGVGVLLPGSSGRGKSTLAASFPEEATLSDERVALRCAPTPWIHGTPWRGTAGRVHPGGAPLRALLFLGEHAGPYGHRPLSRAEAFRRLFFHGLPPLWDREGLAHCLDLCRAVAEQVPAAELRFAPDTGPEQVRAALAAMGAS